MTKDDDVSAMLGAAELDGVVVAVSGEAGTAAACAVLERRLPVLRTRAVASSAGAARDTLAAAVGVASLVRASAIALWSRRSP